MTIVDLSAKLADFYALLEQGADVSPARVLTLEATIALLLEQKHITWQQAQQTVEKHYQALYAKPVSTLHWQWCEDDHRFRLPYQMRVAPVTKS